MKQKNPLIIFAILFSVCAGMLAFPRVGSSAPSATFVVDSNGDSSDAFPGNGTCATAASVCTLRAAIEEANALAGHDLISIGAFTITPATPLPALTDASGTSIVGNNVTSFLDGNNLVTVGLNLESDNNIIQGMLVWNFKDYGIRVWWSDNNLIGTNGDGVNDAAERNIILHNGKGIFLMGGINTVAGNYIGVFGSGTTASPNGTGIYVEGALDANCETVIGTDGNGTGDSAEGNLISGNTNEGILIHNSCVTVAGNIIGLNAAGTAALPNTRGVVVDEYAPQTLIGTNSDGVSDALERNIISGNSDAGITASFGVSQVRIAGNVIGLNPEGTAARGNGYGIHISDSSQITVGTNDDGVRDASEGNVISGNTNAGILLDGSSCTLNTVAGNKIGTNSSGSLAFPNQAGVIITNGAHHNLVGNDGDGTGTVEERNLISGNQIGVGIDGADTSNNTVAGNWIGLGKTGNAALPNEFGIYIDSAPNNLVGTNGDGVGDTRERNIISGNTKQGVLITNVPADGNVIAGNYIGLNPEGNAALKNGSGSSGYGVYVQNAPNTLIGTDGDGVADSSQQNVISGNHVGGVIILGKDSVETIISGNRIGTDASGTMAIPNGSGVPGAGVLLSGCSNARVGSNGDGLFDAAERNLISGNSGYGIHVLEGSGDHLIGGNYIGVKANGSEALGNSQDGILLQGAYGVTIGGTLPALHNTIAFNNGAGIAVGIEISSTREVNNILRGNAIFANFGLGIDLGSDGVTANDPGDPDDGPNDLQNYPVLTAARSSTSRVTVEGSLNSTPSTTFWIDVYASNACDGSGYGEGKSYLGSLTITTTANGRVNFNAELPNWPGAGVIISATATGTDKGSTSEFSQCIAAESLFDMFLPVLFR